MEHMGLGHIGSSRGARICTLPKGCWSAPQWQVLTSFIPNCAAVQGKGKEELVPLELLVSNMGPPNTGLMWAHALSGVRQRVRLREICFISGLSYLVDLSLITISAERLRHSETLYENLNLYRYLCWDKAGGFPPQTQVHLGTHLFQICPACEVMNYFFCIQIVCTPYGVGEGKASCAGFKVQPFHVLPSLLLSFPQTEPFSLSCP